MKKTIIVNHSELILRIAELRMYKQSQENALKESFEDLISTSNLISLFDKTTSQNSPLELAKSGINMALNLIIGQIFGKHQSIKGFLSALLVEHFTTILIDTNLLNIVSGINSLFNRKKQYTENQE